MIKYHCDRCGVEYDEDHWIETERYRISVNVYAGKDQPFKSYNFCKPCTIRLIHEIPDPCAPDEWPSDVDDTDRDKKPFVWR